MFDCRFVIVLQNLLSIEYTVLSLPVLYTQERAAEPVVVAAQTRDEHGISGGLSANVQNGLQYIL